MPPTTTTTHYRHEYAPPAHVTDSIELCVQLHPEATIVHARSHFRRNPASTAGGGELFLHGEQLELLAIALDGQPLEGQALTVTDTGLTLHAAPDCFVLDISVRIYPQRNTALEGLYCSSGNYCTQCEAEGFRKITYFQDRPDCLARFTTRIEADAQSCPILLANGNLIETGALEGGRHYALWMDPFPKPCYLFALVAGDLVAIEDRFVTRSGREIRLQIFVEARNQQKCAHAMQSLKKAMRWDEEVYGLEYDLDRYMIVAVDDFNMGAMENKGLNIFNSKFVLASPETATDQDFVGVEGVIAHEYFHNWTGNRVTCRDWFQLSLKEGLTVFRDQEFSADMNSRFVQRIEDVRILRTFQFKEDSGPMAHPVRPDSFVEINNFYTVTVYNKGAEVVRMLHTLLGENGFQRGMALYFARHDGQAVTCDDFVAAMEDANRDHLTTGLAQFKRWYSQAGTPMVQVVEEWNEEQKKYTLTLAQSCPATPDQPEKQPFHIPLTIGLLNHQGQDMIAPDTLLELREERQSFSFTGLHERPTLSLLRNFSAPVKVAPFHSRDQLAFLMAHDSDLFNRWDAANQLCESILLEGVGALQHGKSLSVDPAFIQAFRHNLQQSTMDKALLAHILTLPSENTLALQMEIIDPDALHRARNGVRAELARQLESEFIRIYEENHDNGPYALTPEAIGRRSLKNACLSLLLAADPLPKPLVQMAFDQYNRQANMTDTMAALSALMHCPAPERQMALDDFYARWQHDPLVVDKWLSLQAGSSLENTLATVQALMGHPAFSLHNPNKVRALIGAFASGNPVRFHVLSGSGYRFLADQILTLDPINPQMAARLSSAFTTWRRYDISRQQLMREQMERIIGQPGLSAGVGEIIQKSLMG